MRNRGIALILAAGLALTGCSAAAVEAAPTRTPYAPYTPPPAAAQPVQTPTPTPIAEAVTLTDDMRHTLSVTFGVGTQAEQGMRDLYCPMDPGGREYYADLVARQLEGHTTATVMQWMTEWCGS